MPNYKIVKSDNANVTSHNSRELKRRIGSTNPVYKEFSSGVYNFCDKTGRVCFQVKYGFRNPKDADAKVVDVLKPVMVKGQKPTKKKQGYVPRIKGETIRTKS